MPTVKGHVASEIRPQLGLGTEDVCKGPGPTGVGAVGVEEAQERHGHQDSQGEQEHPAKGDPPTRAHGRTVAPSAGWCCLVEKAG